MSNDEKPRGPTEEIVRKLLAMNPHLRGEGQTTKDVMGLVAKNMAQPQAAPEPELKAAAKSLGQAFDAIIAEHAAATAELAKQRAALKAFTETLEAQKKAALVQACQRVVEAIMRFDRDLTERRHQVLLEQEKAFLSSIGFTAQKLVEAERKLKR
ncbi:MAG: hypothetical protein IT381_19725 [Deltaproteobacteria bacterium]|nr:hypothetical protein [Deltaproteobacteria bacterium]